MKENRISRVIRILTALQSSQNFTVDELAKLFGVSRRTVFRDRKTHRYSISPEFFLPPIDLNLTEALSLCLLIHKAGRHIQMPFADSALRAMLKVENNLPAKIKNYCNIALENVSVKSAPTAPMNMLDRTFSQIKQAMIKKRKVKIGYDSVYDKKTITLTLSPYHLMFHHRAWYVMGHSSMHKDVRTFKLSRIKELKILDKCFLDGQKFDPADHFGRAWSMIPEGKLCNIKLKFSKMVARNVTEVQWHSTQKFHFEKDGSAIMEFRVDGLGEIAWWILGYGDQVEVLTPKKLRDKIKTVSKNISKIYTD